MSNATAVVVAQASTAEKAMFGRMSERAAMQVLEEIAVEAKQLPIKSTDLLTMDEETDRSAWGGLAEREIGRLMRVMNSGPTVRARVRALIGDRAADWRLRTVLAVVVTEWGDREAAPVLAAVVRDAGAPLYLRGAAGDGAVSVGGYEKSGVLTAVLKDTATPLALRANLISSLAAVGADDVDALVREARVPWASAPRGHDYDAVPLRAYDALAKSRNPKAKEALLSLFADVRPGDLTGHSVFMQALGRQHVTEAVPWMIEVLERSPVRYDRGKAAEALGEMGDWRAVPALLRGLDSEDSVVVWHSAEALGKLRAREAAPRLKRLLEGISQDPRFKYNVDPRTGREYSYDHVIPAIRRAYVEVGR